MCELCLWMFGVSGFGRFPLSARGPAAAKPEGLQRKAYATKLEGIAFALGGPWARSKQKFVPRALLDSLCTFSQFSSPPYSGLGQQCFLNATVSCPHQETKAPIHVLKLSLGGLFPSGCAPEVSQVWDARGPNHAIECLDETCQQIRKPEDGLGPWFGHPIDEKHQVTGALCVLFPTSQMGAFRQKSFVFLPQFLPQLLWNEGHLGDQRRRHTTHQN